MALVTIGYNEDDHFCTPESLGLGGDPYLARWGAPDPAALSELVCQTPGTFYEREAEILTAS